MVKVDRTAPTELSKAHLRPRGKVFPSPSEWRDQVLYFLMPDRFSNGQEAARPRYDRLRPAQFLTPDKAGWMAAGKVFQGGTLKGIMSKLDYLKALGVTALWIGPIWKQRADLQTYHGYGIQNFMDVDPRFGTRQDLRDLVDAAHKHKMYVLLDIIYNHTGNNWFYDNNGQPWESMPYRFKPPYPIHGWRSAAGQSVPTINSLEDGMWPQEFQNLEWYSRSGQIQEWDAESWEDPMNPNVQFRRGDFFDLKDLALERMDTLNAVIKVYQYWIALSDCDGFRIDTVKHIPWDASREFCTQIHEFAESIGKENFLLLGEVTGGEYMQRSYLEVFGRNLDAVLDIGEARSKLIGMLKGLSDPKAFFDQFQPHDLLGSHRETGRYHVSVLDDHDMVGSEKRRFAAGANIPARYQQVAHAVGAQLTTLGIPCIYYGTEQALDGNQGRHDYSIEPHLNFEDRYIREAMFAATFGAFGTSGCHVFDPDHPTYLRIAAIARLRNRKDGVGMALRRGRQYFRELSTDGLNFRLPDPGEIVAWSRIMVKRSVVIAINTHGTETRQALVNIDRELHPAGSVLTILYRGDWSDDELRKPPGDQIIRVQQAGERSVIRVELPPAGMIIVTAQAQI